MKATFAGGCFWCLEPPFHETEGVTDALSGYANGKREAVQVDFDPDVVSYMKLLEIFWSHIDPTDAGGQFHDRGEQYRTAIYYHDASQKKQAEATKKEWQEHFRKPIVTDIIKFRNFEPAEERHQDFYKKNPMHYALYKKGSGRDAFLKKRRKVMMKAKLDDLQYKVTQEGGTEPAFDNKYWNSKEEGIYVDIVDGEPLFTSLDKYDSGCGWPSFTKPLAEDILTRKTDLSHMMVRTEVRSRKADSHLGHVFNDGPMPTGLRYCINSAALRFIPKKDMKKEGYGRLLHLFEKIDDKRR